MSDQDVIDGFLEKATIETVASYTVGIAAKENTTIGTGTLITLDGQKLILTARHVIHGAKVEEILFWLRPPAAIIEKAIKDTTEAERGVTTAGVRLPIEFVTENPTLDIAILRLPSDFELPAGARFYDLRESAPFYQWDEDAIEGLSLFVFGFPSENSVPLREEIRDGRNHIENFIGTAYFSSRYLKERNNSASWNGVEMISPDKDFVFDYPKKGSGFMYPSGFSGCGVWVASDGNESLWVSKPVLLGVVHRYFERFSLIAATKVPGLFSGFKHRDSIVPPSDDSQTSAI